MDILLRDILKRIPDRFVLLLTGKRGVKILDNTFPTVKERKADFVAELEDGSIFHLELQTYPDKKMPFRMLEYYLLLMQAYPDKEINQMVLYVGEGAPRMENSIKRKRLFYSYELRDIKEISCKELMESSQIEDKILAVLCRVEEPERYFSRLMSELMELPEKERADYIRKLLTALHYRPKLKLVLKRLLEERKMPLTITEEMMKEDPFFQKGQEIGQERERQRVVISLHKKGKTPEEIAELLDISVEEVNSFLQRGKQPETDGEK
jgi:predicted transposase/invertase (TIGR01784 family)